MRKRTEEINVRVYPTEKKNIQRKARKCGLSTSAYLRTLGTGTTVREAPKEDLVDAYQLIGEIREKCEMDPATYWISHRLGRAARLLLDVLQGKEEEDGGDQDLAGP